MLKAQKRQNEKPIRWAVFHYPLIQRSCKPIDEIDFLTDQNGDREMAGECQGMCGN
jgi:hypothetical protein